MGPIAWIDVETTGLDPHRDRLLEIACIVTDGNMNQVGKPMEVLIAQPDIDRLVEELPPVVRSMHEESGLLTDLGAFDHPASNRCVDAGTADFLIADHIDRMAASLGVDGRILMGGNSITLDRGFLEVHAPQTFQRLHYRSLDVTSVRVFLHTIDGLSDDVEDVTEARAKVAHRGAADIQACIRHARAFRDLLEARFETPGATAAA